MTTIDELGRRAAGAALEDARRRVDPEAGLADIRAGTSPTPQSSSPDRRPGRWLMLASVAAAVVMIVAIAAVVRRDPSPRLAPVDTTPATAPATLPAPTLPVETTPSPTEPSSTEPSSTDPPSAAPGNCSQGTSPRSNEPSSAAPFGPILAASILSCSQMDRQGYGLVLDGSTLWLAGYQPDDSSALFHLDSSMQLLATVVIPGSVIELAADSGVVWAIELSPTDSSVHLLRVDGASGAVLGDIVLQGVAIGDGSVPAAAVSIAGDDVWVSVATGPRVVGHYRRDGSLVENIPLDAAPVDLAAVDGHAYVITTTGDVVAIDAATQQTSVLATLAPSDNINNATIAASETDLWADTSELIHIDLTTGTVTARRPAVVLDLAADPREPGRAWAAPFWTDPEMIPGDGSGDVVRLAPHGVQPDGFLPFETVSFNGVSRLAIADDGTVFGENEYTTGLVRITLNEAVPISSLVPPADPAPLVGSTITSKPYQPSPDVPVPPILINGFDTNLSSMAGRCERDNCDTAIALYADLGPSGQSSSALPAMYLVVERLIDRDSLGQPIWRVMDAVAVETNGTGEFVDISLEGCGDTVAREYEGLWIIAALEDGPSLPSAPLRLWGWNVAFERIQELDPAVIDQCVVVGDD